LYYLQHIIGIFINMTTTAQLIDQAKQRGTTSNVPYAGSFTPTEAFAFLQQNPQARLVDVRTDAECHWIGVPIAPHLPTVHIQWTTYPDGQKNECFETELKNAIHIDQPVLFMCRSGGRSHSAASLAQQLGFQQVYNVLEGFEGDKDAHKHRNSIGGWRAAGCPWQQN
jgi:rhodanese-related sulfurtransferase